MGIFNFLFGKKKIPTRPPPVPRRIFRPSQKPSPISLIGTPEQRKLLSERLDRARAACIRPVEPISEGPQIAIDKVRCPFCHEDINAEVAQLACNSCRAWHHQECWTEGGNKCSACKESKTGVESKKSQSGVFKDNWNARIELRVPDVAHLETAFKQGMDQTFSQVDQHLKKGMDQMEQDMRDVFGGTPSFFKWRMEKNENLKRKK